MANALSFILKLQDMLTPGMRQAARISDTSAGKIQSEFDKISRGGRKMGASVNELRERLDAVNRVRFGTQLEKEFNIATRAANKLERQIGKLENKGNADRSGGGLGMGGLIKGNLITAGITMGAGLAKDAVGSIITGFAKQQQNITGLKTFLGEAGAKEAYANIKKDAAVTPFDTESLLTTNRALISAGLNAKQAREDSMNLANAISAVGGGSAELSRMAANMQQIKTVGVATSMDIKQFGMAGINIYQLLADETGKNIKEVKNMDVTYDLLSRSLKRAAQEGGAYYGAMEAQGQTVSGKWSTFMDNIQMGAADIGLKLEPIITRLLDLAMRVTDKFSDWIAYLQPVFDVINQIPEYIRGIVDGSSRWSEYFNVIKSFALALWSTVKSLLGNIWHIVGGVIEWMGKSELLKDIFWAIGQVAEGLLATIRAIGDMIQWVWDNVIKPIVDAVDWVYSKVKGLFGGGTAEVVVRADTKSFKPEGVQVAPGTPGAMVFHMPPDTQAPKGGVKHLPAKNGDAPIPGDRSKSINEGGQRSIVINIGKQIEKLEVSVLSAKEGVNEIEAMVREAMRRVVYSMNGATG